MEFKVLLILALLPILIISGCSAPGQLPSDTSYKPADSKIPADNSAQPADQKSSDKPAAKTTDTVADKTPASPESKDKDIATSGSGTSSTSSSKTLVGFNLNNHESFSPHIMFIDAMKNGRVWLPSEDAVTGEWDSGVEIPLDQNGWPLEIPYDPDGTGPVKPQEVKTWILDNFDHPYPAGEYTLKFEGNGIIELWGDVETNGLAHLTFTKTGTHKVSIPKPTSNGIFLGISMSDKSDPVRNIQLLLPGFEDSEKTNQYHPFYPPFIERLKGFGAIRASQLMEINEGHYKCDNGVDVKDADCYMGWEKRPKTTYYTQTTNKGVAAEYAIEIANKAKVDFWPGIIHAADESYLRGLAKLIKERLNPNLKVYVELSNEAWNSGYSYPQSKYFANLEAKLNLNIKTHREGRAAFAKRTVETWKIFLEEFKGQEDRIIKVMPGHLSTPSTGDELLALLKNPVINPDKLEADALAIAAYFGGGIGDDIVNEGLLATIAVGEILNRAEEDIKGQMLDEIKGNKQVADAHGVKLIAYEGGQHLVGVEHMDNEQLANKLIEANRNPRMYDLYKMLLEKWFGAGGDLLIIHDYVIKPTKYGSWGSLEYIDQPIQDAHKYRALRDYVQNN